MGCDIHIVVEKRWGDRWVGVRTDEVVNCAHYAKDQRDFSAPGVGMRSYAFFARLAGVRGDGPEPLGLPPDASDLTAMLAEEWEHDGHSFSHLPLVEFAMRWCANDAAFVHELVQERLAGESVRYHRLLDAASMGAWSYETNDEDNYRVVFWFDN